MKPTVTFTKTSNAKVLQQRLKKLVKPAVYVGVPAAERTAQLLGMAGKVSGKRKAKLLKVADISVNNAELLYIHTKGSELQGIPPRPVLEPAIEAPGNKEAIATKTCIRHNHACARPMSHFRSTSKTPSGFHLSHRRHSLQHRALPDWSAHSVNRVLHETGEGVHADNINAPIVVG